MKIPWMAISALSVVAGALILGLRTAATAALPENTLLSFKGASGWINAPALTAADLRGRVVLVDFWTYTCVNWRRTLPYVRAWSEKYKDQGLVVIGVHTPEFSFEKDLRNVTEAVKQARVPYPVVVDSDYRIWNAFANQYWPAAYLIDATGRVRFFHAGEGEYARTEREIQLLLREAGRMDVSGDLVAAWGVGAEASADLLTLRSPETYLGYARGENFAGQFIDDKPHSYEAPARLAQNTWGLSGDWTVGREHATANAASAAISYQFHARDVNLIMGSAPGSGPLRFRITIDGAKPGPHHGIDVDENGEGTIIEPRMYQLIRQRGPIADRRIEIHFLGAGARAYDFTFG
jgi:thiol-disulfide isomerase/thioredoxin